MIYILFVSLAFFVPSFDALRLKESQSALKLTLHDDDACNTDLTFLGKENLFLWSMLRSTEHVLVDHFLKHYANIGIDIPERASFLVHNEDPSSFQKISTVLEKWQIPKSSIETATTYSSKLKAEHVNKWLAKLPKDAWVVYPDADEFFTYPCEIKTKIEEGHDAFDGLMADRVGSNFEMNELMPEPSIEEQFPMQCEKMRESYGGQAKKTYLFKAVSHGQHRQMKNSHSLLHFTLEDPVLEKVNWETGDLQMEDGSLSDLVIAQHVIEGGNDASNSPVPTVSMGFFPHYFWTRNTAREAHQKLSGYTGVKNTRGKVGVYQKLLEMFDESYDEPKLNAKGIEFFTQHCKHA